MEREEDGAKDAENCRVAIGRIRTRLEYIDEERKERLAFIKKHLDSALKTLENLAPNCEWRLLLSLQPIDGEREALHDLCLERGKLMAVLKILEEGEK